MSVLGIDPGTNCGWALRHGPDSYDSGVWDLRSKRHEGGGMRYLRMRAALQNILNAFTPDAVFYEEVRRHMGVDAAHVYGGIVAVISEECEARGIPYKGVPVSTAKKLATGKGNAKKDAMVAAARERWPGFDPASDDEADARFIAEAGWREVGCE